MGAIGRGPPNRQSVAAFWPIAIRFFLTKFDSFSSGNSARIPLPRAPFIAGLGVFLLGCTFSFEINVLCLFDVSASHPETIDESFRDFVFRRPSLLS